MKKTIKNKTMLQKVLKMAVLPVVAVTAFLSFSAFTGVGEVGEKNYQTRDLTTCYRDKDGAEVGWSNDCKSTTDRNSKCVDGHCPNGTTESNNW